MIRASKITDYGIGLLAVMAGDPGRRLHTVRELSEATRLPQPTISKVFKRLAGRGLLRSERGVGGGYRLGRPAESITVADIIAALEGPLSLAACVDRPGACAMEPHCTVRGVWGHANRVLRDALSGLTLAEIAASAGPLSPDAGPAQRVEAEEVEHG